MKFARLSLSVALAIGSCGSCFKSVAFAQENIISKQIEIPIIRSYSSDIGMTARGRLISTDREWQALQQSLNNKDRSEQLPKIDFKTSIVIVYHQSKSGCNDIAVSKLVGTLSNTGDLVIRVAASVPMRGNDDVLQDKNETCQAMRYRTTLYRIDRAGINSVQRRPLSDYLTNPEININLSR